MNPPTELIGAITFGGVSLRVKLTPVTAHPQHANSFQGPQELKRGDPLSEQEHQKTIFHFLIRAAQSEGHLQEAEAYQRLAQQLGLQVPMQSESAANASDAILSTGDEDAGFVPIFVLRDFVESDAIDPIYVEQSYFVEPEPPSEEPFALFARSLEIKRTHAVGTIEMARRDRLCRLRPISGPMILDILLNPEVVRQIPAVVKKEVSPAELNVALSLVDMLLQPSEEARSSNDQYSVALRTIIAAKATPTYISWEQSRWTTCACARSAGRSSGGSGGKGSRAPGSAPVNSAPHGRPESRCERGRASISTKLCACAFVAGVQY